MFNLKKLFLSFGLVLFFTINCFASAPDFKLSNLNGIPVELKEYKNKKPVLLLFWNTRCPYCVTQIKELTKTHKQLTDKGIELLAVNTGDSKERIERFFKQTGFFLPQVLLDSDLEVSDKYQIIGIPSYFLIDKKGEVRFEEHSFPQQELIDQIVKE